MDIYDFLAGHGIAYQRVDHPPVYTCEQARELVPELPGMEVKNLFLRDRKGRRHFLVVVGYDKNVDLKALSGELQAPGLSMASPERLARHLAVEPGSVTLLAVVNDPGGTVEVVVDAEVWAATRLRCHPLVNTATLSVERAAIERLFAVTGHVPRVIEVPARV
jgi:Ala-tRNA(Pro) deacylase